MDFETSCWSAGSSLINSSTAFYNVDNPVQRRPKIDYFDSSSITPIVSHISSNGYYGYCPTVHHMPSTLAEVHQENSAPIVNGTANDIDFSMSDVDVPVKLTQYTAAQAATPTNEQKQPPQQPMHHQGRPMFENRKRTVQFIDECIADQDIKRPRRNQLSAIDYAEDMQMSHDDIKDVATNAYTNFAANRLSIDQYFVCIQKSNKVMNQSHLGCDKLAAANAYSEFAHKPRLLSNMAIKKSEIGDAAATSATQKSGAAAEVATNDMETLYWHTHGSLLWQH